MSDYDYLSLHMMRLKRGDEWMNDGSGLCFVFPKGGAGVYVCGSVKQPLLPGDLLVLCSSMAGRLSPGSGDDEFVFWWFSSGLEHMIPLLAAKEICLIPFVANNFKNSKRYMAESALAVECHRLIGEVPPQFNIDHRSQLLRVVTCILSDEFKTSGVSRAGFMRSGEQMIRTLEELSTADILTLPVAELVQRFNCSQRHLNRLFHDRFGISVAALRMEMRLLKAMALLRNPDAKVIDVAEQCGFNHLGLFNECFKRRFDSTPGKWRQKTYEAAFPTASHDDSQLDCRMRNIGLCPWSGVSKGSNSVKAASSQLSRAPFPRRSAPRQTGAIPAGKAASRLLDASLIPAPE